MIWRFKEGFVTRFFGNRLVWIASSAFVVMGCNSFRTLDGVVVDAGGGVDAGVDAEESPDASTASTYTPIESNLLFRLKNECPQEDSEAFRIDVIGANQPSETRPTGFSIALDSDGVGFLRWRTGVESRGASVSMNSRLNGSSYVAGRGFWSDFESEVIDTLVARSDVGDVPLNFFSGTLTKCTAGVFFHGENGSQEFSASLTNDVEFQQACPAGKQEFGLGTAGGFNPFNPEQAFGFFYMTSFHADELTSWNLDDPMTHNANATIDSGLLPDYTEPFVESTTGVLVGFGSRDQEHFLFWDSLLGGEVLDSGFLGVPGKIALLHLDSEHYVLAVVERNAIALYRFEYRVDENEKTEIVWVDNDLRILTNTEVAFVELAAMPGGFTVFYDQKTLWTFQPIILAEDTPAERLVMTESQVVYPYNVEIDYTDMDFTATVFGCDLVFSMVAGYTRLGTDFTNFEGGAITNFYGQARP